MSSAPLGRNLSGGIFFARLPRDLNGSWVQAALAVRDLASGVELAWQPVLDQTAEANVPMLMSLLDRYGPPLALKSDNGPAL